MELHKEYVRKLKLKQHSLNRDFFLSRLNCSDNNTDNFSPPFYKSKSVDFSLKKNLFQGSFVILMLFLWNTFIHAAVVLAKTVNFVLVSFP